MPSPSPPASPPRPAPVRPAALRPGDRVAVVSPASPLGDRAALDRGMERLRRWGLRPELGTHALTNTGRYAGNDAQRAADLQRAFDDPEIRGILCVRGGYGCTRLLPDLDWSAMREDPRPLLGYSDITALLAAQWREAGVIGFHGPMVATGEDFAMGEANRRLQRGLLTESKVAPALPDDADGPTRPHVIVEGTAEGRLAGGNLSLVQALIGTPWEIDTTDCLVFLEDIGEVPYRVDRMLTQLRQGGFFARAKGVLLGDFHVEDTPLATEVGAMVEVFRDRLGDLAIPVVHGLPFGHRPRSWTLPFGAMARVEAPDEAATPRVRLLEPAVRG